jgi:hypothetical protein
LRQAESPHDGVAVFGGFSTFREITVEPSSFLTLNGHGAFTPLKSGSLLFQSGSSVNHLLAHHFAAEAAYGVRLLLF